MDEPSITYQVVRGCKKGAVYVPHKHRNGQYVVSKSRFKKDYVYVGSHCEVFEYLKKGYKVRMSDPVDRSSPSLVRLESLDISE